MDHISISIKPKKNEEIQSEIFFDEKLFVLNFEGLYYNAVGQVTDPESGEQDDIDISVYLELVQIAFDLKTI